MILLPYYVITNVTWGISFDKLSVLLDCCITGLCHPINKNYVLKEDGSHLKKKKKKKTEKWLSTDKRADPGQVAH